MRKEFQALSFALPAVHYDGASLQNALLFQFDLL